MARNSWVCGERRGQALLLLFFLRHSIEMIIRDWPQKGQHLSGNWLPLWVPQTGCGHRITGPFASVWSRRAWITLPSSAILSSVWLFCVGASSYVSGAVAVAPVSTSFNPQQPISQPYMTTGVSLPAAHPQQAPAPPQSLYSSANVPHQQML